MVSNPRIPSSRSFGWFTHRLGESNSDLMALIGSALEYAGPGYLLPTRNADLFRWCLSEGLRVVKPMTLMAMRTSRFCRAIVGKTSGAATARPRRSSRLTAPPLLPASPAAG